MARFAFTYRAVVGWIVLGAWVVSFLTAIIVRDYHPPPELNAALLVVVVALFGSAAKP